MALAINGVTQRRPCCATLPLLPRLRTSDEKAVNKVKTTYTYCKVSFTHGSQRYSTFIESGYFYWNSLIIFKFR